MCAAASVGRLAGAGCRRAICHKPQKEGIGASAADMEAVQHYALCVTLRQRKEQQTDFEWV